MEQSYNLRSPAVKRLMREAVELKDKTEQFSAQPLDDNLFEWHFTIRGPADTEFENGLYHGRIILPPDYPMKPPSIILLTPSGRFETNKKICLSISGFHPETWQPSWSLRTALLGIIGFMPSHGNGAIGSLDYTPEERKVLAKKSQEWKCPQCGPIINLVLPITELSKKLNEEAKEIGQQINMQGEKPKVTMTSDGVTTTTTLTTSTTPTTAASTSSTSAAVTAPASAPPTTTSAFPSFAPHSFPPNFQSFMQNNPAMLPQLPLPFLPPMFPPPPFPFQFPPFPMTTNTQQNVFPIQQFPHFMNPMFNNYWNIPGFQYQWPFAAFTAATTTSTTTTTTATTTLATAATTFTSIASTSTLTSNLVSTASIAGSIITTSSTATTVTGLAPSTATTKTTTTKTVAAATVSQASKSIATGTSSTTSTAASTMPVTSIRISTITTTSTQTKPSVMSQFNDLKESTSSVYPSSSSSSSSSPTTSSLSSLPLPSSSATTMTSSTSTDSAESNELRQRKNIQSSSTSVTTSVSNQIPSTNGVDPIPEPVANQHRHRRVRRRMVNTVADLFVTLLLFCIFGLLARRVCMFF